MPSLAARGCVAALVLALGNTAHISADDQEQESTPFTSSVAIHSGQNLSDVVRVLAANQLSVCLQPARHFGWAGLGNLLISLNAQVIYALDHAPTLHFKFNRMAFSRFSSLLYLEERDGPGRGCRRDGFDRGLDGRSARPVCLHTPSTLTPSSQQRIPFDAMVLDTNSTRLFDGDTLQIGCSAADPSGSALDYARRTAWSSDYTRTRTIISQRYWAAEVARVFSDDSRQHYLLLLRLWPAEPCDRRCAIARTRHGRSASAQGTSSPSRKSIEASPMPDTRAAAVRPFLAPLANLSSCVTVLLVTEDSNDAQARMVVSDFKQAGGAGVLLLGSRACGARCALRTMTHADALLAGYSSLSMLAAILSKGSQLLAYTPRMTTGGRSTMEALRQADAHARQQANHSYIESPAEFAAQVQAKCDETADLRASRASDVESPRPPPSPPSPGAPPEPGRGAVSVES
jgi:hypothetical protein